MKRIILSFFLLSFLEVVNGQNFPKLNEAFRLNQLNPPTGKVRMVLDTDTYNEEDDQFALSYAYLSNEKIELTAVYAAPFTDNFTKDPGKGMELSYQEIQKILKMLGKSPEGFVFRGSDRYLEDISTPVESEAVLDLIKKASVSSPENPLFVVTIGCITNISSAILLKPEIIENIVVVWLGGNDLNFPHQNEYNLRQDVLAAQIILNSGVPLVIMPCTPVVSHLHTTLPELKHYLAGKNKLSDYLYQNVVEGSEGHEVYSKVIWDVAAIAWLVNPQWIQTNIVHSPILTDQLTYSVDRSRHFIRMANLLNRDAIYRDLFTKLAQ